MIGEHQHQDEINYTNNVVVEGRNYFQSLAHQLGEFLCEKQYPEFRLTAEYGFTSTKLFIETVEVPGGYFLSTKYSQKKCIGVILYDIETNKMTLRKTNVDRTVHEFHADGELDDCFGVQYDVFKYLRDSDLIEIHTQEMINGVKMAFCYRINKFKALKNGRFLHFKGHGTQFFIPIADFKKSEGTKVKKQKSRKSSNKKGRSGYAK